MYGEDKDRNVEKNIFVIFEIYLKQSKKEKKFMVTNY